jgi:hypothetical protein
MRKPFPYKVTSGWNSNRIGPNDHCVSDLEDVRPRDVGAVFPDHLEVHDVRADPTDVGGHGGTPARGYSSSQALTFYISSGLTTPITCPSGSLNWPSSTMSMIFSGPITRVPPRLSALVSASSMSSTAT